MPLVQELVAEVAVQSLQAGATLALSAQLLLVEEVSVSVELLQSHPQEVLLVALVGLASLAKTLCSLPFCVEVAHVRQADPDLGFFDDDDQIDHSYQIVHTTSPRCLTRPSLNL
eukprot:5673643-Amphidinium_carterae.1